MLSFKPLVLAAVLGAALAESGERELSFTAIAGYTPKTDVSDHARIDLDQKMIQDEIAGKTKSDFVDGEYVYQQGAHSKSVSQIHLGAGLPFDIAKGTELVGQNTASDSVRVKAYRYLQAGETIISVQYDGPDCYVGASTEPVTTGCLAASGNVLVDGDTNPIAYTYTPLDDTFNGRTIKGFATDSSKYRPATGGDFFPTYQKFVDYYGSQSYADEWVNAAFQGSSTSFANGNADFSKVDFDGWLEGVQKGTAYMAVWAYVIRELEDSIDDCVRGCDREECNLDAVHALDEAVAFYTGSLQGTTGDGEGVMLYQLAQKLCAYYRTCGEDGNSLEGTAMVNTKIFQDFNGMKDLLAVKDCEAAAARKDNIIAQMGVPLVQGTLRYAYFIGERNDDTEKSDAEGATFAAAILPVLAHCNKGDADTVYNNMKLGTNDVDFSAVKAAFDNNLECMGISSGDVSGTGTLSGTPSSSPGSLGIPSGVPSGTPSLMPVTQFPTPSAHFPAPSSNATWAYASKLLLSLFLIWALDFLFF